MIRGKYLEDAFKKYNEGKISEEAYDAILMNIDNFCEEDEDESQNEFQKDLIMEQQEQM